jgi:poly-gamma-glutamate capsule biosynthesis protein CapA/YwtB (metallophosphatase superfamily)
MKKRIIIYLTCATIVAFATLMYVRNTKTVSEPGKSYRFDMYYAPVAEYFSEKSNVTIDELKKENEKRNLIVETGERDNVSKILGVDAATIVEKNGSDIKGDLTAGKIGILKWSSVTPDQKTLMADGKYIWRKADFSDYELKYGVEADDPSALAQKFNPEKLTKITSTGDVILGRTVARKMAELGFFHPWEKISSRIKDADITFANLEVPLSDLVKPPYEGMSFVAPKGAVIGLIDSGVDIVALGNNHSTNFGTKEFLNMLSLLKEKAILWVGGGENIAEAEKATIIEKNGQKWAFLNWNAIVGAVSAKKDSPGVAQVSMKPWSPTDSEADFVKVEKAIFDAKKVSDVVIVEYHWGVEYVTNQLDSQRTLARRSIDAGADLIVGTHPHAVQGSEIYKGKYITYSLGNFIFDQEWSQGTKEGTVLESYFYGTRNVASNLAPILIEDFNQPRFLSDIEGRSIIERIKSVSLGL